MRTDYTVIVTVEHPPGSRPAASSLEREAIDLLQPSDAAAENEVAIIGVEVTGWRPWPDNPSDPRSWVGE